MKIRPVFDRLVVERIEQASTTASGLLVIPEDAKAPAQMGRVLAVGHGRNYDGPGAVRVVRPQAFHVRSLQPGEEPPSGGITDEVFYAEFERPKMVVKPGDRVLYGKYSGAEVEVDGARVFILREDEVLAILEDEASDVPAEPKTEPTPEAAPVH